MERQSGNVPCAGSVGERDGLQRRGRPEDVVDEQLRGRRTLNDEKSVSFRWMKLSEGDRLNKTGREMSVKECFERDERREKKERTARDEREIEE